MPSFFAVDLTDTDGNRRGVRYINLSTIAYADNHNGDAGRYTSTVEITLIGGEKLNLAGKTAEDFVLTLMKYFEHPIDPRPLLAAQT